MRPVGAAEGGLLRLPDHPELARSGYDLRSASGALELVRRLEAAGSLTVYSVAHAGRLRKFYRLTPGGVEQIDQFLAGWPEIERIYAMIKESAEYDARAVSE